MYVWKKITETRDWVSERNIVMMDKCFWINAPQWCFWQTKKEEFLSFSILTSRQLLESAHDDGEGVVVAVEKGRREEGEGEEQDDNNDDDDNSDGSRKKKQEINEQEEGRWREKDDYKKSKDE